MKCPKCNSEDYIQFVFVHHTDENGIFKTENPSDEHFLYMCPSRHIYNENQLELWLVDNSL